MATFVDSGAVLVVGLPRIATGSTGIYLGHRISLGAWVRHSLTLGTSLGLCNGLHLMSPHQALQLPCHRPLRLQKES